MTYQRLAAAAAICFLGAWFGCARPASNAVPAATEAPRGGFEKPENSYYHFMAAQTERLSGNTDKAILLLRKAIDADPGSAYLRRELATIYVQSKEEEKALAVLNELLVQNPDDVKGLILLGGIQQGRKQTAAAIDAFEKVVRLDGSQEKIYSILGGLYLEGNDLGNAERVLGQAVERFPNSYAGHFLLGRVHLARGKPALAEKAFRKSADADPESIEPLFEVLKIAREQGRREDILKLNMEILNRDPDNSRAFLELALYYRNVGMKADSEEILKRMGDRSRTEFEVVLQVIQGFVDPKKFDDALYILNGMLKTAPDNQDLRHLKGFSLFGLKKNAEALPEFSRVTPESRFYQDALVHIAFILQEQGKIDEAVAQLSEAIQKNPENADLRYYLATVYEEAGRYSDAETHLKQAIEKDPENSRYYFRLGVVYDKQKRKEDSIEAMRKVIALDPQNANALNYLGYTYADLGEKLDEAEQLILAALRQKPNDGYITDSLGWVYYKKGEYEKALQHLKKASELVPDDPVIMEHVGDTYLKLNDKSNALKSYQKAMAKREKEKNKDPEKAKEKAELQKKIRQLKEGVR